MAKVVFIDAEVTGYTPSQVSDTVSAYELAMTFDRIAKYEGADTRVYLRFNNGYSYGAINGWYINIEDCEELDEEEEYEDEDEGE